MKIGIVTDKSRAKILHNEEGLMEDQVKKSTAGSVEEALKTKYETVSLVYDKDIITKLKMENVDLVFNLCNGVRGESRLSQLPSMLEAEGIPYTGSGPVPHGIAYNKIFSGKIFKASSIPTPGFFTVKSVEEVEGLRLKFPVLVKPKDEGSSRGIKDDSLVYTEEALKRKVAENLESYNPPVMITEYIEGEEFTVGILGNGENLRVLPIMEIDLSELPGSMNQIYSFEAKFEYEDCVTFHIPGRVDDAMKKKIEEISVRAYLSLGLRDYARVDIRVKDGIPYVIEINSLPGLNKGISDIVKMAEKDGMPYEALVLSIVDIALERLPKEEEEGINDVV